MGIPEMLVHWLVHRSTYLRYPSSTCVDLRSPLLHWIASSLEAHDLELLDKLLIPFDGSPVPDLSSPIRSPGFLP